MRGSRTITAKYPGTCKRCGLSVNVGDLITWSTKHRGIVFHVQCPDGSHSTSSESTSNESHTESSDSDNHFDDYSTRTEDKSVTGASTPATNGTHSNGTDLASHIASAIANYLPAGAIDADAVRGIFREETRSLTSDLIELITAETAKLNAVTTVTVHTAATDETRDMGVQHKCFPKLLKMLSARINVWLAGPSGSGKTQASLNAANALGLKFYFCGAQSNEYGLSGYIDAKGDTVRTLFREAYEHGGLFLFDEVDASNPSALLWLNAALDNGHCAFPDAVVRRHPDFVCIAAANTWGLGATNDYVGRMKMDAAFLARFVRCAWDYDEGLELAISGNADWCKRVQSVRARARAKGLKVIISPRDTLYGSKLLAVGLDQSDVEDCTIFAGLTPEQKASIQ